MKNAGMMMVVAIMTLVGTLNKKKGRSRMNINFPWNQFILFVVLELYYYLFILTHYVGY